VRGWLEDCGGRGGKRGKHQEKSSKRRVRSRLATLETSNRAHDGVIQCVCFRPRGRMSVRLSTHSECGKPGVEADEGLGNSAIEQAHEARGGEIGGEKFFVFHACGVEQLLGGKISAADGAFHGGRPAGTSPVAGEKNARP
jgi:hypothetical protein